MSLRRPLSEEVAMHQRVVLRALQSAERPLGAYQLLKQLKADGITWPPTIYRALRKLMDQGLIHKLETLKAFVPCKHSHDSGHLEPQEGPTCFALCRKCGHATEFVEPDISLAFVNWSRNTGFSIEDGVIELRGLCSNCRTDHIAKRHR